jgi:hypothetical protein
MQKSSEFSLSIGELQLPLDITSIVQAQSGQLGTASHPDFSFRFRYRETGFTVRCSSRERHASAHLSATLGVMPFSAESATQRHYLKEIHRGAVAHLGPIIALSRGRFQLDTHLPLSAPITAVGLITELTRFLLPLKPYIELMAMVRMVNG